MAQKVNVVVTDDFDGSEGASTVRFGLDGTDYEVDLNPEHEKIMRDFLNAYIGVGRRVTTSGRTVRRISRRSSSSGDVNAMRQWARENGYEVAARGRISQEIKDAYHAAKGGPAPAPTPTEPSEPVQDESAGIAASAVPAEAQFSQA